MGKKADAKRRRTERKRSERKAEQQREAAIWARRRSFGLISHTVVRQLHVEPDGSFDIPNDEDERRMRYAA